MVFRCFRKSLDKALTFTLTDSPDTRLLSNRRFVLSSSNSAEEERQNIDETDRTEASLYYF